MAVTTGIFEERDNWRGSLAFSVVLHTLLFGSMIFLAAMSGTAGENWGGTGSGGGAMSATLVSSVPLPANPEATNVLATESKGLTQSLPKPVEKIPDAIPIPDRDAKRKPTPAPKTPTKEIPKELRAEVDNRIPFGQGGPVSGPYGVFNAGGAKGGISVGGSGDFGSRYGWYVDVVRRKVSENWLKQEVDPGVSTARRVYIYFEIDRSGSVPRSSLRVEQSSGVPSLDQSALRALQRIDTFGPLPGDYRGSNVAVEFWFDYRR